MHCEAYIRLSLPGSGLSIVFCTPTLPGAPAREYSSTTPDTNGGMDEWMERRTEGAVVWTATVGALLLSSLAEEEKIRQALSGRRGIE